MPSSDQTIGSAIMAPAPCLGRLPPEIIHIILDLLRKDKRSLLSCGRINKRWRGVALSHLFVELKYRASDSFDRLFDFLRGRPELAGMVKKLYLYKKIERAKYRAPGGLGLLMVSDDYPLFDHAKFIGLLPKLSNLRELVLEDVNVYDEPLYPERTVRLPFVLRQLELRGNSSFAVLRKLFDRLEIGTIKFGSGSSLPKLRKSPTHTFAIPRLVVSREAAGLLIPLQKVIRLDSLRSLTVAVRFMTQMDALCALLSKAGHALTNLDIDLVQPVSDLTHKRTELIATSWTPLGEALRACDALQSLRVAVPVRWRDELHAGLDRVPDDQLLGLFAGVFVLQHLPATIGKVTICFSKAPGGFRIAGREGVRPHQSKPVLWDLATLDEVLASRRFPLLKEEKSVRIEVDIGTACKDDVDAVRDAIAEALPRLRAASVLAIVTLEA